MRHGFIVDIRREALRDSFARLFGQFLGVVCEAVIFSRIFVKTSFGVLDIAAVIIKDLRP